MTRAEAGHSAVREGEGPHAVEKRRGVLVLLTLRGARRRRRDGRVTLGKDSPSADGRWPGSCEVGSVGAMRNDMAKEMIAFGCDRR